MSYSFGFRAPSKAQAILDLPAHFDAATTNQTCHASDREQALAAGAAFIGVLADDDTKDVAVTISGYLSGHWSGGDVTKIANAGFNLSAGLVDRTAT